MKISLLALSLLMAFQTSAQAEERAWAPYRMLMETIKLDKLDALPAAEHDKVIVYATITPSNKNIKPSDVVLTLVHGSERQAFHVSADHKLNMPFKRTWFDDDAQIMINQPKGEKMGINFAIDAALPAGTQWSYASLMGSVKQSNALIKSQAGMLSLLVPSMKTVVLQFAKPAQLTIATKDGARTVSSDAKNAIRLKPEDALMRENPTMSVTERPLEAQLDTE